MKPLRRRFVFETVHRRKNGSTYDVNLLRNTGDAMPNGGTITLKAYILVTAYADGDTLQADQEVGAWKIVSKPMPAQQLRTELEQLQKLLRDTHDIDDSTRQSLAQLASDIQRVMQESVTQPPPDLRQRVDDAVLDFETKHPQLTQILSRVTDLLSNMGI